MLIGVTLGSGVAILDGSVVNVALPTIGRELGATAAQLQWIVAGYLLALASLVLTAGAMGDRFGRRKVYLLGVAWFAVGSLACAFAPTADALVLLRCLQGVGAALMTPGALSLIQASYRPEDRASAIGWWAGTSGLASVVGPLLGGFIIENTSWRWIFGINLPLTVIVIALTLYAAPESRNDEATGRFDLAGTALSVVALGASTYALTSAADASTLQLTLTWVVAAAAAIGFVLVERRTRHPLVPLSLFGSRVFSAANAMTFLVYGALGVVFLILIMQLQVSAGWSPLASGLSGLPVTLAMMLLSSRAAAWSHRIGPRIPMTIGPLISAAGIGMLVPVNASATWLNVLPGVIVFAIGLSLLVSPLTATVLAAAPTQYAGAASGVNNAVARAGSLFAVAAIPPLAGLTGDAYTNPAALTLAFQRSMLACVVLLVLGGLASWFGLRGTQPPTDEVESAS